MLHILFTLDYEIHGNGEGCPRELMIEPTERMLDLFDEYGAKLTIMADVGEILKFKEYAERQKADAFHYSAITTQLRNAVRRGHDVQLHIHSSYFNATSDGQRWLQDWSEYNFAGLAPERLNEMVRTGKHFLESMLQPIDPAYRCIAFRAANWSVSPSENVVAALSRNGILIDSSVFKYGRREGIVNFDYRSAHSELVPWRADDHAIWRENPRGEIWEVPIYSEHRWIGAFLSSNRIYRFLVGRRHRIPNGSYRTTADEKRPAHRNGSSKSLGALARKHAWKADFNQCTGRQLIRALNRAEQRHNTGNRNLPFVLIGHSKLFTQANERSLRPFLKYVAEDSSRFRFGTFDSLKLEGPVPAGN